MNIFKELRFASNEESRCNLSNISMWKIFVSLFVYITDWILYKIRQSLYSEPYNYKSVQKCQSNGKLNVSNSLCFRETRYQQIYFVVSFESFSQFRPGNKYNDIFLRIIKKLYISNWFLCNFMFTKVTKCGITFFY